MSQGRGDLDGLRVCLTSWQVPRRGVLIILYKQVDFTETALSSLWPGPLLTTGTEVSPSTASGAVRGQEPPTHTRLEPITDFSFPHLFLPVQPRGRSCGSGLHWMDPLHLSGPHTRELYPVAKMGWVRVESWGKEQGHEMTTGCPSLSLEVLVPQVLGNPEW